MNKWTMLELVQFWKKAQQNKKQVCIGINGELIIGKCLTDYQEDGYYSSNYTLKLFIENDLGGEFTVTIVPEHIAYFYNREDNRKV